MKISKETLDILKNFHGIHGNMMFNKGNVLLTRSEAADLFAEAEIKETIDFTAGISDLNQILSFMNALESPDLTTVGTQFKISDDIGRAAKFEIADPSVITVVSKKLNFPVADLTFDIKMSELEKIRKAASILRLDTFAIFDRDGKIWVKACHADTSNVFESPICAYDGTATFEIHLTIANLNFIEADHYHVLVSKLGATKFEGRKTDDQGAVTSTGVSYIVSNKHTSKYTA